MDPSKDLRHRKFRLAMAMMVPALTACAEADAPDPDPIPSNSGYQIADPVENPVSGTKAREGRWTSTILEGRPALHYSWGATPQVVLSCDDRQGLNLDLRGQTPVPPAEMIRISTNGETSVYAAKPMSDQRAIRAAIPAADGMISALLQGKPIQIAFGEDEVIAAPASPLVPSLVVRCRGA